MVLLASSYDQSRFFKAADLETEMKLKIKSVTEEQIGTAAEKETKLVVWFTNDDRGLVLNKTNNRTIRGAYGDPVDGWIGRIIIIFPTMVDVRGKMGPAIRVRIPAPKQPAASNEAAAATAATAQSRPAPRRLATSAQPQQSSAKTETLADDLDDEVQF
jgi:hypothetical protein